MGFAAVFVNIALIGVIIFLVGLNAKQARRPPPKTVFKFVPRTFVEEQENPVPVSEIFRDMFEKTTPFIAGFGKPPAKTRDPNKFFISQS